MKTKLVKTLLTLMCVVSILISPSSTNAIVVFDPSNYAQNTLTAIRALKANLNEYKMIENQFKSITNELLNLKKLKFSIIDDLNNQMGDLFEVTGSINGLMQDFANVQREFHNTYPDLKTIEGLNPLEIAEKAEKWLEMSRETILGASETGAKVLQNLPKSQQQLDEVLSQSQGAVGILQAAQAGNQISANIAGNLQTLNAQLATYTQAHMTTMMNQQASHEAQVAINKRSLEDWGKRRTFVKADPLPGL